MKYFLLSVILLLKISCFSQQGDTVVLDKVSFYEQDGYNISNPMSAIYDDNGWLWIFGENKLTSEFVFNERELIIQRFDGVSFFNIKIPINFTEKIKSGYFIKNVNGGLFLKLFFEKNSKTRLLHIDTEKIEIKKIDAYTKLIENLEVDGYYTIKNSNRLIVTSREKLYSAKIEDFKVTVLDSISYKGIKPSLFIKNISVAGYYVIVQLLSNEYFLLNSDGKFLKMFTSKDFINKKGNSFSPERLNHFFTQNKEYHAYFDDFNLVKFDTINQKFIEQSKRKITNDANTYSAFIKTKNRFLYSKKANSLFELKLAEFKDNTIQIIEEFKIKNNYNLVSRDLKNGFAALEEDKLTLYFFKNHKIKTYLRGKSIRGITELSNNKYLVATDSEGFYEVDVTKNTQKEVLFSYRNKTNPISYSRDLFIENSTIVTNDVGNIIISDKNYNIIEKANSKFPSEEIIKVGDTIFKGGQNGKIFKYSIKNKIYTEIQKTSDIIIKEFTTDGKTLFATSSKGLFIYKDGVYNTYNFKNEETEDLLSIHFDEYYGLLITTKYGKIYKFDFIKKTLDLFYEDELNASIVGIIVDNNKKLWLNTYAGIVGFNPITNSKKRYGKNEGIFELEGNRYSTYKDSKGNILMGSFKGLSFFNPKELTKSNLKVTPKFTSISFFNSKKGIWERNISPNSLNNLKTITLPPEYQRFIATASIFGEINPKNFKFRGRLLDEQGKADWFTIFAGKPIQYANLAPGNYTLEVEALSATKEKIGETLVLQVISSKVFYKKWWFITLFIFIILSITLYILNQIKQKQILATNNKIALNESKIKSAMMLEIHHRIKNNLQIVSGLLGLQMIHSNNEDLKSKLQDTQTRIESIAGIHEILYDSESQDYIKIKKRVHKIISYYKKLLPIKANFIINIDDTFLHVDKAIPLSLLLNELINNSNKHAFSKVENPKIKIDFTKTENTYKFEYLDNGNFNKESLKNKSMGMKIIDMMNQQLKGDLKIENNNGFKLTLKFKK